MVLMLARTLRVQVLLGLHPNRNSSHRMFRQGQRNRVRTLKQPIYVQPYGSSTRFFMIDRRREGEELCEEFKVLGSTGNVRWFKILNL